MLKLYTEPNLNQNCWFLVYVRLWFWFNSTRFKNQFGYRFGSVRFGWTEWLTKLLDINKTESTYIYMHCSLLCICWINLDSQSKKKRLQITFPITWTFNNLMGWESEEILRRGIIYFDSTLHIWLSSSYNSGSRGVLKWGRRVTLFWVKLTLEN